MSIASRAARRHLGGVLLSLMVIAAGASGCGGKPPAAPAGEPPQALRQQQPVPGPTEASARAQAPAQVQAPARAQAKLAAPAADESARVREELAQVSASLKASEVEAEKLRQQLKAARSDVRGWHAACKAAQAQAATLQKTAAALKDQNAALQGQVASFAAALRDAQAMLAGQSQPASPAGTLDASAAVAPASDLVPLAPEAASPPLGVVRDVRAFRGRPYATVSAGHEAGVRRGMRLGLADPRTGAPAGVVTIDEVGTAEAGGVVEGADARDLRVGLWVHGPGNLGQ